MFITYQNYTDELPYIFQRVHLVVYLLSMLFLLDAVQLSSVINLSPYTIILVIQVVPQFDAASEKCMTGMLFHVTCLRKIKMCNVVAELL